MFVNTQFVSMQHFRPHGAHTRLTIVTFNQLFTFIGFKSPFGVTKIYSLSDLASFS